MNIRLIFRSNYISCFLLVFVLSLNLVCGQNATDPPTFPLRDLGLASIWTQSNTSNEEKTPVRVIQGFLNWNMLESGGPGIYDWTNLNEILNRASNLQKPVLLQINGNSPDWLSNEVPWLNFYLRRIKVHQFWHPNYINRYKDLLNAFAVQLDGDPRKVWVAGVRLQTNGFHTEAWDWRYNNDEPWNKALEAYASKSVPYPNQPDNPANWVVPSGVSVHYPLLTYSDHSVGVDYMKEIILAHKNAFHSRGIRTFARLELENVSEFQTWLDNNYWNDPLAGILVTNMGVWQAGTQTLYNARSITDQYNIPLYSEDVLSAGERLRAPTPEQEIYWRQLLKLHANVTYSATYMEDLDEIGNPAWDEGFEMINRYAGLYDDPASSTGAFIVFASWSSGNPQIAVENIGYFLQQSNLNATSKESGVGSNTIHYGYRAKSLTALNLEIGMNATFANQINGKGVQIRVTYFDQQNDDWELYTHNGTNLVKITDRSTIGNRWKTDVFSLSGAAFPGNGTNDIVLKKTGSVAPVFHKVEVLIDSSGGGTGPVGLLNQSGGDIIMYPNPVKSKLNVTNFTSSNKVEILDLSGKVVMSEAHKRKHIKEIDVSILKNGIYLLKLTGNDMSKIIRFLKQ